MDHVSVPKVEHSSLRSRDFLIFLGLCVAALSAALIWLALGRHDHNAVRIDALQGQVDRLQGQLRAVRRSAQTAQIATLRATLQAKSPALVSRCLGEVQQEIDDIRSFIAFGGAIRRRVSPNCTPLLRPRFGG
jgi:hypothetical protein